MTKEGQNIHGFELQKVSVINLPKLKLYELIHRDTQAKHLHIEAEDENNCFSVAFRTVPKDSTGIAHILEHIVLCGSQNFKARDPFFSMLNRSMNTFMNAFTAQDWTMYPFATCNPTDFNNLLRVYLDATFFPLLKEESFMQEGHYLTFSGDDYKTAPLDISGVVFNEMKGAMSSQSQMMYRKTTEAVYPSITYHYNSGGDPLQIPKLRWEELRDFHAGNYHPSNAMFFTYGNMPFEGHLKLINEQVLSKFKSLKIMTDIPPETRFQKPQQFNYPYAYSGDPKDMEQAYQTALAWLTNPIVSVQETVSMGLLDEIILGNSAAALKKSLLESNLGKSLSDVCGYSGELSETFFAAGLQGVHKNHISQVGELVKNTLKDVVSKGIDKRQIESVIHNFELEHREVNKGSFPKGLEYILQTYPYWSNGANPAEILDFEHLTGNLRKNLEKNNRYFENLIEKNLLDNTHCVEVTLHPDDAFNRKQDENIAKYLQDIEAIISEDERAVIAEKVLSLEADRNKENDIDALPFLPLSEIILQKTYADPLETGGTPEIYRYDAETNGIAYYKLLFCLPELTDEERLLLPAFSYLFNKAGTEAYSYDELSLQMNLYTGGISSAFEVQDTLQEPNQFFDYLEFGGKALYRNIDKFVSLSDELLNRFTFKDTGRVKNLLSQRFTGMMNSVNESGHLYALSAANRKLTPASAISEMYKGFTQISQSAKYEQFNAEQLTAFLSQLSALGKKMMSSDNIRVFTCADKNMLNPFTEKLSRFISSLPSSLPATTTKPRNKKTAEFVNEAWLFQSPVSYVIKSIPTVNYNHPDSPAIFAAANFIQAEYIHPEIREKGGAYGGKCLYDHITGVFTFLSYRDPQYKNSLDVYDRLPEWFAKHGINRTKLEETILSSFRKLDMPLSSVQKSIQDFSRRFMGQQREKVDAFRKKLIGIREDDIANAITKYLCRPGSCATVTSEDIYKNNFDSSEGSPQKMKLSL